MNGYYPNAGIHRRSKVTTMSRSIAFSTCIFVLSLPSVSACGGKSLHLDDDPSTVGSGGGGTGGGASVELVISNQPDACALAIDESRLYWIAEAGIFSCAKDSCETTLTKYETLSDQSFPTRAVLAVADGSVFWERSSNDPNTGYEIVACPSSGCVGKPRVVTSLGNSWFDSFAVDGKTVFLNSFLNTAILSCPVSGCAGPGLFASQQSATSLTLDDTFLYWVGGDEFSDLSVVRRARKDGSGDPEQLATGLNQAAALSVNAKSVSFTTRFSLGGVAYCPIDGCTGMPAALAADQPFPLSIASDESNVYWINTSLPGSARAGGVMRSAFADPVAVEIEGQTGPDQPSGHAIAVDEHHVYWISPGTRGDKWNYPNASIHRAAKVW